MNFVQLTTLKIGGPIKRFVEAKSEEEIITKVDEVVKKRIPYFVIGEGSNLLVSDKGFDGVVIKNTVRGIKMVGRILEVSSGTDLSELVSWANKHGIAGFERLVGIPGTVGGAVYGNAGAYGATIADNIIWVKILRLKNSKTKKLKKEECGFSYRHSKFKETKEIILSIGFSVSSGKPVELKESSREVMEKRIIKYPPGIACPGSFFKNVEAEKLSKTLLAKIPEDKVMFGKIPAGWLLEEVGAKGVKRGDVEIAPWHGNLFINKGGGKASDFLYLAKKYWRRVKEKFGIELEPEVQLVGFNKNPF